MSILQVEKVGGLAGFGGGHLRSRGVVDSGKLSAEDQEAVEALFKSATRPPSAVRDGFSFRISRSTGFKNETVEVAEHLVPPALAECVRDELV